MSGRTRLVCAAIAVVCLVGTSIAVAGAAQPRNSPSIATAEMPLAGPDGARLASKSKPAGPHYVKGELLVRFRGGVQAAERANLRRRLGVKAKRSTKLAGLQVVATRRGQSLKSLAHSFEQNPEVEFAEPNHLRRIAQVPNDPSFNQQWALRNTGQTVAGLPGTAGADIGATSAWDQTTGSTNVVMAVVDTGIEYNHPDLAPNVWTNPGETGTDGGGNNKQTNGIDDDGNGLVDDWRGWDFYQGDNNPRDYNGHGTHVSGILGARGNNGIGTAGINWNSKIMPLRVCSGDGSCPDDAIASAFAYAGAKQVGAVNASFGGPARSQAISDAITSSPNTMFVVAAGNEGADVDTAPVYPCAYPAANLICVAATDNLDRLAVGDINDSLSFFSNSGEGSVDLAAPGTRVLSSVPALGAPVYTDDFETPLDGRWQNGGVGRPWERSRPDAFFGDYGLTDSAGTCTGTSQGCYYAPNSNSWTRTPVPNLSAHEGCFVDTLMSFQIATGDATPVELPPDHLIFEGWNGNQPTPLAYFYSFGAGEFIYSVSDYEHLSGAALGFRMVSDAVQQNEGTSVDNFSIRCLALPLNGSEHVFLSGTSMATPMVTGAVGLMRAAKPSATVAELRRALLRGTRYLPSLEGTGTRATATDGRLDIPGALAELNPAGSSVKLQPSGEIEAKTALGTNSNVSVSQSGNTYTITDSAAPLAASTGCSQVGASTVTCASSSVGLVHVFLRDGNDTLTNTASTNVRIEGEDGVDTLTNNSDAGVTLLGGDGNDTLTQAGTSSAVLRGGGGNDLITGGPQFDFLYGGEGNDGLMGGDTADLIHAGPGDDQLDGQDGDDLLDGNSGSDTVSGGDGVDQISYYGSHESVIVDLDGQAHDDGAPGEADTNSSDIENLIGSHQTDQLTGNGLANKIDTSGGLDVVHALGGDDTVEVGAAGYHRSSSTFYGGDGNDTLSGAGFDDVLYGEGDNDTLRGNDGDDLLDGGSGDDTLFGDEYNPGVNDGNDDLEGGPGDDTLDGEQGIDIHNGGPDTDTVKFSDTAYAVRVDLDGKSRDDGSQETHYKETVLEIENVTQEGHGVAMLTGNNQPNVLTGGSGKDQIKGLGGDDVIDGGYSDDKLWGGNQNDTITGAQGRDYYYGEGNDDTIFSAGDVGPGTKEVVNCGPGTDTVTPDPTDRLIKCEL